MSDEQATERELEPGAAAALIEAGAEIVDVRRRHEWEAARIAGSRQIEINELSAAAESVPRDRAVVFVCRTGNRSGMAADAFREAGWDARNLAGGIAGWAAHGLPLEPEEGEVLAPSPGP